MAVDHSQIVVIVLGRHLTRGIGAEGPHLVVKSRGVVNQLRLIHVPVELLADLIPHLDADADIHRADTGLHAVRLADVGEPVRPLASHSRNHVICRVAAALVGEHLLHHIVLDHDVGHHGVELHLHAVLPEVVLQTAVDLVALLRAKMADRAFHQLQIRVDRPAADLADLLLLSDSVDIGVRAEAEIDPVRFLNQFLRPVIAENAGQIASHVRRERQLSV